MRFPARVAAIRRRPSTRQGNALLPGGIQSRVLESREAIIPCRYVGPRIAYGSCTDQASYREDCVALLFDQFGVRRVELHVLMWPGFSHPFKQGELSELYGKLNSEDLFESCELRANVGAEFESEHWNFDISTSRIRLRSESFQSYEDLTKRMMHLLEETQRFFGSRLPFLFTDHVSVRGVVPEGAERDVSEVVLAKMLSRRLDKRDPHGSRPLDSLPGELSGAGVTLVGDTDAYHWHADIGPAHAYPVLPIGADLYFPPPAESPEHSMIAENLDTAYQFITTTVLEFAEKILS